MEKYNIILIKTIKIISILQEMSTLALDLKINQFKLDMNAVDDLNINNHYCDEFILWNYFDLNENNKDIILNNGEYIDEYSAEYRFGTHPDEQIILMDIFKTIVIIHGYYYENKSFII